MFEEFLSRRLRDIEFTRMAPTDGQPENIIPLAQRHKKVLGAQKGIFFCYKQPAHSTENATDHKPTHL